MNKSLKTKLCWNCEGSVSRSIENCPYCGVYLSPESAEEKEASASPILTPHYSPEIKKESLIPKAPYIPEEARSESIPEAPSVTTISTPLQTVFLPVLLLSTGVIALFFALILLLFSTQGTLTLQWDGENWYLFGLLSLPLLVVGWILLIRSDQ